MKKIVVTGAGGFIGGHLVKYLLKYYNGQAIIRAVDIKPLDKWYQVSIEADNLVLDLRKLENCYFALNGFNEVYNLAADMGGMGFIENNRALCMISVLINTHLLLAAKDLGIKRYFYSSSACVYNTDKQKTTDNIGLKESDAYPAMPEDGYGWEKLFSERMCKHFRDDFGIETRVARFHNVYGPCFDQNTEVLTDKGWKKFENLNQTESILSLNPELGTMEYLQPIAYQSYDYVGPMHRVVSRSVDQLVTPEHSVYTTASRGVISRESYKLTQPAVVWDLARLKFTSHGIWEGERISKIVIPEVRMSDGRTLHRSKIVDPKLWFEFVGWYISEGSSWITERNYTVNISQKPGEKHDRIRTIIASLGFQAHSNGNNIIISNKQLFQAVQEFGRGAREKIIPKYLLNASPDLLKILWISLMAGDGTGFKRYTTNSQKLADTFQELSLKLGWRAWISYDGCWRINLSSRTGTDTQRKHRWVEYYNGRVYDVTLPRNHVLMVRRNGKPCWSGNCGTYAGGKEKAPAAICRKIIEANLTKQDTITIWGDGEQTRSFMYVDDCVTGIIKIMESDIEEPINLGSTEIVSINQLVNIVEAISGKQFKKKYDLSAPKGVRGRNSDNTLLKHYFNWEPNISLNEGLVPTYNWIYEKMIKR